MNGKLIVKSETLPLPLFLKSVKISTEIRINAKWNVVNKKPQRIFDYRFSEKETTSWFDAKYINRTKKQGKDTVKFKPYKMCLMYDEKSLQIEANLHLKRKINNGRWTKSCR